MPCIQGYKEFIDAEHLMPLPTSDFKQPVCVELNCLRREGFAPRALPETAPSLDSSGISFLQTHWQIF